MTTFRHWVCGLFTRTSYHRPAGPIIRRQLVVSLLAPALVVLTACGSSKTMGHPLATSPKTAATAKTSYDVSVYLCNDTPASSGNCSTHGPPGAQLAAVRTALQRDPAVRDLLFLSEPDTFQLAKKTLPADQRKYLSVGVLPAVFLVGLVSGASSEPAFTAKYSKLAGVKAVVSCQRPLQFCSTKLLHSVGITK